MLNCNETITIYHKSYDEEKRTDVYTPTVIDGCSWFAKTQSAVSEKGMVNDDTFIVRVPLENAPEELIFTKGDYVLKGSVSLKEARPSDILKHNEGVFLITSYSVNDKGSPYTKHIRISGS